MRVAIYDQMKEKWLIFCITNSPFKIFIFEN